jgi:hypothetical protein
MVWMSGAVLGILLAAYPGADPAPDPPVSLRGSPASMAQQHRVAVEHGLTFFRTEAQIHEAVARGELMELPGGADYAVADFVDLPYLHPAGKLFVERTAALYREACGEPLVVTSGVRAIEDQPWNAHDLSVHPAGMAVDVRVSAEQSCRAWLEEKLQTLEALRVLNGIREFRPPHYHVAVFPEPYTAYAAANPIAAAAPLPPPPAAEPPPEERSPSRVLPVLLAGLALAIGLMVWQLRRKRLRTPGEP